MKTNSMKRFAFLSLLALFFLITPKHSQGQSLYFPPTNSDNNWDTLSPAAMGWCVSQIDSLYDYLQQQNSKAFILLKDGKIAMEKYFGTFTRDSLWYWASAGKTLTAFLVGKARQEGVLDLQDTTAHYLGQGWTSCTSIEEQKIRIIHQLTMGTGLNDAVPDNHCTFDTCLVCLAEPGTRWAYHNAPYTLLEPLLNAATGVSVNSYTQTRLKIPTGITGFWQTVGYDNVFFSKARSMARFGLLAQNRFVWNGNALLTDTNYINALTNTSQNFNLSYGYLWWLNGKPSYMLPGYQMVISGPIAPHAPADMFSGIGKNGQLVSVSRSAGLVMVRMGNDGSASEVATVLLDRIWEKLNAIMCTTTRTEKNEPPVSCFPLMPNPVKDKLFFQAPETSGISIRLYDLFGRVVYSSFAPGWQDLSSLPSGIYTLLSLRGNQVLCRYRLVKE